MEFPLVSPNGYSRSASKMEFPLVSPNGYSRFVVVGAVSLGVLLFLMGKDEQKALDLGPERATNGRVLGSCEETLSLCSHSQYRCSLRTFPAYIGVAEEPHFCNSNSNHQLEAVSSFFPKSFQP